LEERNTNLGTLSNRVHRGIDLFKYAAILIPANLNNSHWVWFLVHPETRSIHAYDGFHHSLRRYFQMLLNWLQVEATKEGCTYSFLRAEWTFVDEKGPLQTNAIDCGIFLLKGIEYACDDLPLIFGDKPEEEVLNFQGLGDAGYAKEEELLSKAIEASIAAYWDMFARDREIMQGVLDT